MRDRARAPRPRPVAEKRVGAKGTPAAAGCQASALRTTKAGRSTIAKRGWSGVSGPVAGCNDEAGGIIRTKSVRTKSRNPDAGRERYKSVITRVQLVPAGICSSAVAN